MYDIPAVVDYILEETGHQRLSYVGHSMGCAVYFIAMSTHPRLNQKIDLMLALAPASTVANMKSPLKLFAPHVHSVQVLLTLFIKFAYRNHRTSTFNLTFKYFRRITGPRNHSIVFNSFKNVGRFKRYANTGIPVKGRLGASTAEADLRSSVKKLANLSQRSLHHRRRRQRKF